MSYLYSESRPLSSINGGYVGKHKGILFTNTDASDAFPQLIVYHPNGTTYAQQILIPYTSTKVFDYRVWGISYSSSIYSGLTAYLLS